MINARWLVLVKKGRVSHLVHEEATGHAQIERSGRLVAVCGQTGNEAEATKDDTKEHCSRCETWR